MVNEELVAGLRNGFERGESLEKSIQTLLSAGYSAQDVKEAADSINFGALAESSKQAIKSAPSPTKEMPVAITSPPKLPEKKEEAQYKPLPTTNTPTPQSPATVVPIAPATTPASTPTTEVKPKKKLPRWLIGLLIFFGFLIVFIILLSMFGEFLLKTFFG